MKVVGDGNCLFHTVQAFYPTVSIDEVVCGCLDEVCTDALNCAKLRITNGFDLDDDESVRDHVMRISNDNQYTGVITSAALPIALHRLFVSIYTEVNEADTHSAVRVIQLKLFHLGFHMRMSYYVSMGMESARPHFG